METYIKKKSTVNRKLVTHTKRHRSVEVGQKVLTVRRDFQKTIQHTKHRNATAVALKPSCRTGNWMA